MLDELKDQTVPQASLAGARDPERDRQRETSVLAALRGNLLARASRHQQGVVYARAMFVEEAGEVAAQLRRSVVAGEVLAELACLGSIVGLNPSVAPHAAFGKAHREDGPAFCLDLDEGCAGWGTVIECSSAPRRAPDRVASRRPASSWCRCRASWPMTSQAAQTHALGDAPRRLDRLA